MWPTLAGALLLVLLVQSVPVAVAPAGALLMVGLAYANGANDLSKGIATLVGAEVADYRRAIRWGVAWTGLGAVAAVALASTLTATFSASFLLGASAYGEREAFAALLGGLVWLLLATRTALPVSTTHAIAGAIVGVGLANGGFAIDWLEIGKKIALPLAASPFIAVALGIGVFKLTHMLPRQISLGNSLHWLSAAGVSFARGTNDAPKIIGLGAAFAVAHQGATIPLWVYIVIALAMATGSWLGSRRVTTTLAERVTRLDEQEGLSANLTTATIVSAASIWGLPVSTTHLSSSAIIGAGARRGKDAVRWRTVWEITSAWLTTAPVSTGLAIIFYLAIA
ncbi:MAG TPA: inorganic phosphate transporter [Dehalococcoidia bacterium]|nr:inorganic phosphate transporter [Dehalococcoidia bacterium]